MAKRAPSEIVQLTLRLREDLRGRLEKQSRLKARSLNAEIIARLDESFSAEEGRLLRSQVEEVQSLLRNIWGPLKRMAVNDQFDPEDELPRIERRVVEYRKQLANTGKLLKLAVDAGNEELIVHLRDQGELLERGLKRLELSLDEIRHEIDLKKKRVLK